MELNVKCIPNLHVAIISYLCFRKLEKKWKCKMCNERFTSKRKKFAHETTKHRNDFEFHCCKLCDEENLFKSVSRFAKHLRSRHQMPHMECPVCHESLSLDGDLNEIVNHINKHKSHCDLCGKHFNSPIMLRNHTTIEHEHVRYQCSICKKMIRYKNNLTTHMKLHKELGLFNCQECGKQYTNKSSYKRHLKKHEGFIQSYLCYICGKSVTSNASLKNHLLIHSGEKLFGCNVCGKKFNTIPLLRTHSVVHTKEKRFKCAVCSKAYSQSGTLSIHMKSHTGEKPFQCIICLKRFVTKTLLKSHNCKSL